MKPVAIFMFSGALVGVFAVMHFEMREWRMVAWDTFTAAFLLARAYLNARHNDRLE